MKVGDAVIYVDEYGVEHFALLTASHGSIMKVEVEGEIKDWYPCVNLIFVSKDETQQDPYGRQVKRESSVSHQTFGTHGRFWKALA